MCWGFEISFGMDKNGKPDYIDVDNINGLKRLCARYGKDVPDAIFDDDYFKNGKRVPVDKIENSCLCPANKDVVLGFASRAIMNELHGIPVDAVLDERQDAVKNAMSSMMDGAIDGLRAVRFAGRGIVVSVRWL